MAGLVPAIHVFGRSPRRKTWMPGTRPGMTEFGVAYAKRHALRSPRSLPMFVAGREPGPEGSAMKTAAWNDDTAARFARDEETVRRDFWSKARKVAAKLPFSEDLLAAYY